MMMSSLVVSVFLFFIICFSNGQTTTRNQDLEVKKTTIREDSDDWKVEVAWRAIGSDVTKVQVIDDIPERFIVSGSLVHESKKDPTKDWSTHVYALRYTIDKSALSLSNQTHEIILPGARVSYSKKGETERKTLTTPTAIISVNVEDEIVIKGGWWFDNTVSTALVALFTIIFPVWAGYSLINRFHSKALARRKAD